MESALIVLVYASSISILLLGFGVMLYLVERGDQKNKPKPPKIIYVNPNTFNPAHSHDVVVKEQKDVERN